MSQNLPVQLLNYFHIKQYKNCLRSTTDLAAEPGKDLGSRSVIDRSKNLENSVQTLKRYLLVLTSDT